MGYPMAIVRGRILQMMADLGSILAERLFWDGGTRRVVDTCIGKKRSAQGGLNLRTHEAAIQVVLVKTRPNTSAELPSLSQAGDVSSRSVFKCAAGPKSAIGHADDANPPIILRKGATDKPPKRMANVLVSLTQAIGLCRGGGTVLYEQSPSAAKMEEGEGALCVRVTTTGVQKVTSLDDTPLQQGLAPRP